MLFRLITVISLILTITLSAAVFSAETPQEKLDRLRTEVDSLSSELDTMRNDEKNLLERINTLDRQIATQLILLNELENQIQQEQKAVSRYNEDINWTNHLLGIAEKELVRVNGEIESLVDLIKRRAIFTYKRGTRETMRFLLAAENPGDLMRRRIYVKRIQERDSKNLLKLKDARNQKQEITRELEDNTRELTRLKTGKMAAVKRTEAMIAGINEEQAKLGANRLELDNLLEDVRRDQDFLANLIEEKQQSAKQVERWVISLERQRTSNAHTVQVIQVSPRNQVEIQVKDVQVFSSFSLARGKLPWPVNGNVIKRFGLERNLMTGTLTDNPGIDIQAREGDEVLAVQGGICTRITYLRGFGTTMLIEHGDGYYTVYAHLGDVWVGEGEEVEAGRIIGTVGDTGTVESPRLHFQIWHKRQNEDPLEWLQNKASISLN